MNSKFSAVVVTTSRTKVSGGVNAGFQLSRAIAEYADYELLAMSNQESIEVEKSGLKVFKYPCFSPLEKLSGYLPQFSSVLEYSPGLMKHIRKSRPQLVHIHNPHPGPALWRIARVCIDNKIPYIMSSHGFNEYSNPRSWYSKNPVMLLAFRHILGKPFRQAVEHATAIFLTSPPEAAIADGLKIPSHKRHIVTNGYDPFFDITPSASDIDNIRQRFGFRSADVPVYLFVGNHTANKGIDTLLEACHLAKKDCVVIIAGAITSAKAHARLLKRYHVSESPHKIIFTDYLTREDLRSLYHAVDGFVFPSKADSLPLVILDAMISGLPVIASDVGGISYQVDQETGRLITPGDSAVLAQTLDELSSSKELRITLGKAGQKRARDRFSWQKSAQLALSIYSDLIGSRKLVQITSGL